MDNRKNNQTDYNNDGRPIMENEQLAKGNEAINLIDEAFDWDKKNKYIRRYSYIYIAFSSIAYIFGFLENIFLFQTKHWLYK